MARRRLGLAPGQAVSIAGGLTFHGAPLNNYMAHGAASMVRAMRAGAPRGLLYGQGGHLTSHHALLLGREPAADAAVLRPSDQSAQAAARRGPAPAVIEDAAGEATAETFTVLFQPDGAVAHGAVVLRLPGGARTLARVPAEDGGTLARLMAPEASAVGARGSLSPGADGLLRWTA